ncbi:MAG: hypothetical protein FH753_06565 [Firmicutes bacterium]|nr:hypothetical protein [Bacillota bacterium]
MIRGHKIFISLIIYLIIFSLIGLIILYFGVLRSPFNLGSSNDKETYDYSLTEVKQTLYFLILDWSVKAWQPVGPPVWE